MPLENGGSNWLPIIEPYCCWAEDSYGSWADDGGKHKPDPGDRQAQSAVHTLKLVPSVLPYQWTPSTLPARCSRCLLSSAWLWYMQTLLTRCRCQVWAGIILPRWVIKHIWSVSAFPTRPQQPALGYVLRLDCRGSPATCTFLKINLSHIGGQETARLCATSTRAQWLEHYQGGRVRNGTIWITCDICHCFIVTRRRSLKQWCAVRCYLPDFSFTPELPERVNRVSFVWHVTAN